MNYIYKNKTYFAKPKDDPKDRIELEVGDSKTSDKFIPQQKIIRFDNECNVSIRLIEDKDELKETATIIEENGKIKHIKSKRECHFYNLGISAEHPEDASEFEIIFKSKPKTNIVSFSVVDKDVDYFRQEALTPEEIAEGASQPENVIGSYAIYAKTPKTNWTGGKEYKCGKIGHIFRPRIIDSAGTEVWGELNINKGILSVVIPQDFLDKAVYPVRHAAGLTFGYSTQGATSAAWTINEALGSFLNTAASVTGSIDSISIYAKSNDANDPALDQVKGFVVNASTLAIITNSITGATDLPNTTAWTTINYGTKPSVTSGTTYSPFFVFKSNGTQNPVVYRDAGGASGDSKYESDNNFTTPTNPAGLSSSTYKYSIYATYTEGGAKPQINIGDTWKQSTAVQINIGDTWKTVTKMQINIGDVWKTIFSLLLAITTLWKK